MFVSQTGQKYLCYPPVACIPFFVWHCHAPPHLWIFNRSYLLSLLPSWLRFQYLHIASIICTSICRVDFGWVTPTMHFFIFIYQEYFSCWHLHNHGRSSFCRNTRKSRTSTHGFSICTAWPQSSTSASWNLSSLDLRLLISHCCRSLPSLGGQSSISRAKLSSSCNFFISWAKKAAKPSSFGKPSMSGISMFTSGNSFMNSYGSRNSSDSHISFFWAWEVFFERRVFGGDCCPALSHICCAISTNLESRLPATSNAGLEHSPNSSHKDLDWEERVVITSSGRKESNPEMTCTRNLIHSFLACQDVKFPIEPHGCSL